METWKWDFFPFRRQSLPHSLLNDCCFSSIYLFWKAPEDLINVLEYLKVRRRYGRIDVVIWYELMKGHVTFTRILMRVSFPLASNPFLIHLSVTWFIYLFWKALEDLPNVQEYLRMRGRHVSFDVIWSELMKRYALRINGYVST